MDMKVVALAGGVGGAKLADGLAAVLAPEDLTVVVNTGDDFDHLGLRVCPDLDTVLYTLAGVVNPETGWGRAQESWDFLETLGEFGGPTWFKLGDRDLALHVLRTAQLRAGRPLSAITHDLGRKLGVEVRVLPMSDAPISTIVLSDAGELSFQEYFVARRCVPQVRGFRFEGIEHAQAAPGVLEALHLADLIVLCPSNPWVSLDPILAIGEIRRVVSAKRGVGVSPIVNGRAIKGPAAKMFSELGIPPSAHAVAEHFQDLLCGLLIDHQDKSEASAIEDLGVRALVTDIIMKSSEERKQLGARVLAFASRLTETEAEQ